MHLQAVAHSGVWEEKKGFEGNFPEVGQVRFLASQEVIDLSGRLSCKTWEYKGHLNRGAACCRHCGQLYLGESLGFLMINLLVRARQQPLWGDWYLQKFQQLEHNLLTKGEVIVKGVLKNIAFLVGCCVGKTWHLNGGAACCRLYGQLYVLG